MIDVRELRIGNIVNDDTNLAQEIGCKVVGIVESISEENIELKYLRSDGDTFYGDEYPINLSPIRLTEELLLMCWTDYDPIRKSYYDSPSGFIFQFDGEWCTISYGEYRLKAIKYFHQLQNLYFDLTGQELEIKDLYSL